MSLFGYFSIGLSAMNAARLGLQVAGDNIANVSTPGYVRRRLDLVTAYPVRVTGGLLDQGVDIARVRRMEERYLQASLEREQGRLAGEEERLTGLQDIEAQFGTLDGEGIASAMSRFSAAFDQLAAQPESTALRGEAVAAAEGLAETLRSTYGRLTEQRRQKDEAVVQTVEETNALAEELAQLNREIATEEADGTVAAPLRDRRTQVVEALSELTGGSASTGPDGKVSFHLSGGPTLVTSDNAIGLNVRRSPLGYTRVLSAADGSDVTDRIRDGRLGAQLYLRDEAIPAQLDTLDTLAGYMTSRSNSRTTGAFDLQGNPGEPLFIPDPPPGTGAARVIAVNDALLQDPSLLAVSATGAPGDGSVAVSIAEIPEQSAVALGRRSPQAFLADALSALGNEIVQTDIAHGVAADLVDTLQIRRDDASGVSLDEEAVELMRNQRTFEAAARFLQVMNSITEVAVNLGA